MAAGHSLEVDPARWQEPFDGLLGRIAGRSARVEPRRRARGFVQGLLADLPRKHCWTIAEHAEDATPDGMQHLLGRAVWHHDGVRDDLRAYLVEHLGDPEEEPFQTAKGLCGLDQHQVPRWRSWYRWTTLAMLAHAFLMVAALTERTRHPPPSGLIGLPCNEVQHLFATLAARPAGDLGHRLRWSVWRRRHQARASTCHYQRQANGP